MILRDPVHGLISLDEKAERIVVRLLDTYEVQRLRRIRCLGPASLAFPGAEHSRFAHAVGSAFVMKRYLARVKQLAADIPAHDRIDADTAQIALAAALLHDLGHGPYSHTFEAIVGGFCHEDWTSRLILDPDTEVHGVLREFDPSMPQAVHDLLHGKSPIPHLARAVSGTFDVDRCDYLMRDSHMTGVRYGLLDLDWLLQSLRLYLPDNTSAARLAVDGEKGLTAVEGFFLGRLYMYRQVYLHKAVRAAELVMKALFVRLGELRGDLAGVHASLLASVRDKPLTVGEFLDLDDAQLDVAIRNLCSHPDAVVSSLASRLRRRKLFKTMRLRKDVTIEAALPRLQEIVKQADVGPSYFATIDRAQIDAYTEDEAMMVRSGDRMERLLDVSPVLRGLNNESFVHVRAVFPPEVRQRVTRELADLAEAQ